MHGIPAMVSEYRHTEIASCQDSTDLPTRINQLDPILHFTSRRRWLACVERLIFRLADFLNCSHSRSRRFGKMVASVYAVLAEEHWSWQGKAAASGSLQFTSAISCVSARGGLVSLGGHQLPISAHLRGIESNGIRAAGLYLNVVVV